ncbi:MAG: TAXI family TRAP transporter solute-binding subunit [Acetobacterales bacterium]
MKRLALATVAAVAFGGLYAGTASAQQNVFTVGTAGVTGSFYPSGGYACNYLNRSRQEYGHNYRCVVESTQGSVSNLRNLQSGDLDLGFAQADLQYHSYNGTGAFEKDGANKGLRYIMTFTVNRLHLVSREDTGIKGISDLKGKRVNSGNPGSGTEATSYMTLKYWGMDKDDLGLDSKLTSREQSSALCDNKVDAFFYPTAPGVAAIGEAFDTCNAVMVDLDGPELQKLLSEHPYYGRVPVSAGTYTGSKEVHTFGYGATLVATDRLPDDFGYFFTKAVFENFDALKQASSIFESMSKEISAGFGRSGVPWQPGAERYFKEVGLIK